MTRSTQASMKIEKGRSAGMNGGQLIKGHGPHGRDQLFVPSKDDRALVLTSASQHCDTVTGYADSSHEFFRNFSPQLQIRILRIEFSKRTRESNPCWNYIYTFLCWSFLKIVKQEGVHCLDLKTKEKKGKKMKEIIAVEEKRKILRANNPFLETWKTELFFYFLN